MNIDEELQDLEQRVRAIRFWSKVDQSGGPDSCWLWTGPVFKQTGYGQSPRMAPYEKGTTAHRQAWVLTNGEPEPYVGPGGRPLARRVRHACPDGPNRLCCNPAHLELGTDKENAEDRQKQGGEVRGSAVPQSVLNEELVHEIRTRRFLFLEPVKDIADDLGFARSTVSSVVNFHSWTWMEVQRLLESLWTECKSRPHYTYWAMLRHSEYCYDVEDYLCDVLGYEHQKVINAFQEAVVVVFGKPLHELTKQDAVDLDKKIALWLGTTK